MTALYHTYVHYRFAKISPMDKYILIPHAPFSCSSIVRIYWLYEFTVCATLSGTLLYLHIVWMLNMYVCVVYVRMYTLIPHTLCSCMYVCVHCVCHILQDPVVLAYCVDNECVCVHCVLYTPGPCGTCI